MLCRRGHTAVPVQPQQPSPACQARTMQGSGSGRTRCWRSTVNRSLPRLIFQWLILLPHVMYSTEGLSELRHQLTDTGVNTTASSNAFHWNEHVPWTACSTTCGYGVQYQDRSCLNQRNEFVDAKFCLGPRRQYKVCKTGVLQCPSYARFSRTRQCSQHRELGLTWKPYFDPSVGPCQVACYAASPVGRNSRILDQWLPDGTLCANYRGCDWWNSAVLSKGVCLQGQCSGVGCDGIVNSTKVLDSCGVCGGDGSSCRVISAKFSANLQESYTEVVEIPEGAHNIRVYELERSKHFLAITDEAGNYLLNGHFQIVNPGQYEVAGTTVIYKRCGTSSGHYEEIGIQGPTIAKIVIWIVSANKYSESHIAYQYSMSLPTQPPTHTTVAPLWTTSDQPGEAESSTLPGNGQEASNDVTPAVLGHRDLHNVIAVKTVPYDSKDISVNAPTQGTKDELPFPPPDSSGVSSSQHNMSLETTRIPGQETAENSSPNSTTSLEFTTPVKVEKTEIAAEMKNLSQQVGQTEGERSRENLLPLSQNSSLHQEKLLPPKQAGMFSESAGTQNAESRRLHTPDSVLQKGNDLEIFQDDILGTSGSPEIGLRETTTETILEYSDTTKFLTPDSDEQSVSGTTEPYMLLNTEAQTDSPVPSRTPNTSTTSGQLHHLQNGLITDDESIFEDASYHEEQSSLKEVSESTKTPPTLTQRTITVERVDDSQDAPFGGKRDSSELLFEEVPQIMELVKPSAGSQDLAASPSAAATAVVVSRGDIPMEEWGVKPRYRWERTGVAPCSATCSRGMSRSYAYCTLDGEQVSDTLCDPASKPEVVERECGGRSCQPRWAVGSWSQCTVSCDTGSIYRTVHCWLMIAPGLDTSISNSYCNQSNVPDSVRSCSLSPCGPQWQTSDWSECSVQCGEGVQQREVRCSVEGGSCNPQSRPPATKRCMIRTCPNQWTASQWTACRGVCMVQFRRVDCVNPGGIIVAESNCPADEKPLSHRLCGKACPAQWVPQSWGQCRGVCGSTKRRRRVVCAATSSVSGRVQILAESVCSSSQKPAIQSSCQLVSCQQQVPRRRRHSPQWLTTPWSVCSVTCGRGQRTREITCNRKRNQQHLNCNENKRPDSTEPCVMGDCPAVVPACSDSPTADCNLIRRANLCRYDSYKRSCCLSCSP